MDKNLETLPVYWANFLRQEFEKETDRGAVVLTASLLENALTSLLKKRLVPNPNSNDELFDGPTAPISSYNAKIQLTQRLGLISPRLARDLGLIRKMRNEFAHNIHGSSLETGKTKDILTSLTKSSKILVGHGKARSSFPQGARGDFLAIATSILFHLQGMIDDPDKAAPIDSLTEEWMYSFIFQEPETRPEVNEVKRSSAPDVSH